MLLQRAIKCGTVAGNARAKNRYDCKLYLMLLTEMDGQTDRQTDKPTNHLNDGQQHAKFDRLFVSSQVKIQ